MSDLEVIYDLKLSLKCQSVNDAGWAAWTGFQTLQSSLKHQNWSDLAWCMSSSCRSNSSLSKLWNIILVVSAGFLSLLLLVANVRKLQVGRASIDCGNACSGFGGGYGRYGMQTAIRGQGGASLNWSLECMYPACEGSASKIIADSFLTRSWCPYGCYSFGN